MELKNALKIFTREGGQIYGSNYDILADFITITGTPWKSSEID